MPAAALSHASNNCFIVAPSHTRAGATRPAISRLLQFPQNAEFRFEIQTKPVQLAAGSLWRATSGLDKASPHPGDVAKQTMVVSSVLVGSSGGMIGGEARVRRYELPCCRTWLDFPTRFQAVVHTSIKSLSR